jgi:excinuclease UvrABC nuclease subunit
MELTKEQINQPGVYIFWLGFDAQYIGASKHCIGRATDVRHDMVRYRHDYDWVEFRFTETECEALDLEATLIKNMKPRYNKRPGSGRTQSAARRDARRSTSQK